MAVVFGELVLLVIKIRLKHQVQFSQAAVAGQRHLLALLDLQHLREEKGTFQTTEETASVLGTFSPLAVRL